MKHKFITIFTYILVFILLILTFNLSLYVVCSFPSEWIYDNVLKSSTRLLKEGNMFEIGFVELIDNYTDSLIINEAYSIDSTKPLESYMFARKNFQPGLTSHILPDTEGSLFSFAANRKTDSGEPIPDLIYDTTLELSNFLNKKVTTAVNYSRYYHGFLILFRPMLLLGDITKIRIFMILIFLVLLIYLAYLLKQKFNKNISYIFTYALLAYGYFYMAYSLQQSPLFLVVLISTIILIKKIETYSVSKLYMHLFITRSLCKFF